MNILVVEDNSLMAQLIQSALTRQNFAVTVVTDGTSAIDSLQKQQFDMVILDLRLGDEYGVDILRKARNANLNTPVIILSGDLDPMTKVAAFTAGADDYVTKPFKVDELVARIHAVDRRAKRANSQEIRLGRLTLRLQDRCAIVGDATLNLTRKEFDLLEALASQKGRTLNKEAILERIYGGRDEPQPKIIDVFVCKLRKKLADALGGDGVIRTVWGQGYTIEDPALAAPRVKRAV